MLDTFVSFLRDTSGATAIEYALIAGGIALVIIAAVNTIGGQVLDDIASASNSF
jgi:pilus assembly protein Flp/PilA